MSLETVKYARKPFLVDSIQVTAENMEDVAKWCEGTLETNSRGDQFIRVAVHRPLYDRQTKAFAGDWVLFAGNGFKVYTVKAFETSFELFNDTIRVDALKRSMSNHPSSPSPASMKPMASVTNIRR